jgi:hypothetical protein
VQIIGRQIIYLQPVVGKRIGKAKAFIATSVRATPATPIQAPVKKAPAKKVVRKRK